MDGALQRKRQETDTEIDSGRDVKNRRRTLMAG